MTILEGESGGYSVDSSINENASSSYYLVAERYEGDIYVGTNAVKFLKELKPHYAKAVIYEYFSSL